MGHLEIDGIIVAAEMRISQEMGMPKRCKLPIL